MAAAANRAMTTGGWQWLRGGRRSTKPVGATLGVCH